MSNIATALKAEISRVARKELKGDIDSLRKVASRQRSEIAALKKEVMALTRLTRTLTKASGKYSPNSRGGPAETGEAKLRFQAKGFATLRKKLDLSANDMGRLVGVTGQSIYLWEAGKTVPRASQLPAIAAVRKLGKREALAKLAALG